VIKLTNRTINVDVNTILQALLIELQQKGIDYLRVLKQNGNNIQTCCPYHKDGKERKPSGGITTVETPRAEAGVFHCFTCGMVATLPQLISHVFGFIDDGKYGEKWLLENFSSYKTTTRKDVLVKALQNLFQAPTQGQKYVTEEELQTYRYTHPYMYKRKLTNEIIEKFDVGFDKSTNCITFPCNDINGNCLFITRRSVVGKFYNYPAGVDKPVYALDKIEQGTSVIVVCESIINTLTLWSWGIPSVALLGTGTMSQYEILRKFNARKYILAFDGDEAGDKAILRFKKNVPNKLIDYYEIPRGKDVNDLTYEEFKNLEKKGI